MRKLTLILFLLLFLSPFLATAQQDRIDFFIIDQMKQQGIAGLSIGVIKNGKIIKAKGYGLSNVELNVPALEKTMFKIGSISKQFVAVGIMKLAQDGKLKLSDPITKFIKNAPATWDSITIRQVMNHTAGFRLDPPHWEEMKDLSDSFYIRSAFTDTLVFSSGSQFHYSNFGYFILADIIRISSHLSFPDYMKKYIFDECGMNTIRPTSVDSIIPNRASGYTKNADGSIQNAPNYIALRPSGAFISDITDLLKWEIVMQTNKLLTRKSWSQMWDDTIKTPFRMDNFSDFAGNEPMFYGYGWMTSKYKGGKSIHHAGSMPGFKSVYFRYVEDNTAIIILTNFDKADTYGIAFGVSDLLQAKDKKK